MLTQSQLKQYLSYNPETGLFYRLTSRTHNAKIGDVAGCKDGQGYINIRVYGGRHKAHRLAWLYVYAEFPGSDLDHVNGIRTDNRISNLRIATRSENSLNTGLRSTNTSGFRGVSFNKKNNRWRVQAQYNGKKNHLGNFKSAEQASAVYEEFAKKHHREFYRKAI